MTAPNGLRKHQLKQSSSGKIVSRMKSENPSAYQVKMKETRRSGKPFFTYKGNTYFAMQTKTGMIVFTRDENKAARSMRGRSISPRRSRRSNRR